MQSAIGRIRPDLVRDFSARKSRTRRQLGMPPPSGSTARPSHRWASRPTALFGTAWAACRGTNLTQDLAISETLDRSGDFTVWASHRMAETSSTMFGTEEWN